MLECPRCFWLQIVKNIKRPQGIFPSLPSGMDQVGTVYTSQGFEFDYMGIIFGNDLVWNKETKSWYAKPENTHDTVVKAKNDELVKHLKNVYRVLLTRAHKGVYVYFVDKDTEEYFKSKAKNLGLNI